MQANVRAALDHLTQLWRQEQRTTHQRFVQEREQKSLEERVEAGLALRDLSVRDVDIAPGRRIMLWLDVPDLRSLEELRLGTGSPVRLWWDHPDSERAVEATVARRGNDKLAVMVDGEVPDRLEQGTFHLDRDEPQHTFERGLRALNTFRTAERDSDPERLGAVLFGDRAPSFDTRADALKIKDTALNPAQRQAVEQAMRAHDVALIHGPPGTGKTRTLVEVVRQAVARGERVLATAASNTAVDNLGEKLAEAGLKVVRLGHPARVSPLMEKCTLDALLEKTSASKTTRAWLRDANDLRRRAARLSPQERSERRALYKEASSLSRDARDFLQREQVRVLARSQVVCATAAGADVALLGDEVFDLVVLDESTQATTPVALVALSRARRVVMAGDPKQLPPTVIDMEASRKGLGETMFEQLASREEESVRMLVVQHRMHEVLMRFPSDSMYQGRLVASEEVARHRLEDLGVAPDPLRPGPLAFIDTAGRGWDELRDEEDPSTSNPDQAQRCCAEVRRLLGRGLPASEVAVITPYHAQARLLREGLRYEVSQGLDIGTVDSFQGREKEAIIVDLVRSNERGEIGFLADTRRMNVALTRARRFLMVIGDSATIGGNAWYASFFASVEKVPGAWISAWNDEAPLFDA